MADDSTQVTHSPNTITIYHLPHNLAVFDITAALDTSITDASRGLLWRILAMHARACGTPDWKARLDEVVRKTPEGVDAARACLRELAEHGYARRYQEADATGTHWVVQLAALPVFDGNNLRDDAQTTLPFLALRDTPSKQRRAKK